jgi:4-amino-4-deoxy-L-arabinose transferase-like glycosyltransferase
MDEAMVALNLIHRSFAGLTRPLEFHVTEPMLWLFSGKLCYLLFGGRELSLRLPEILAAIISVVLVLMLGRRLLSAPALCIAVGWFALSRPLIYYASELKPYGSDPAVAALLWLVALWTLARPTWSRIAVLAVCGGFATWFSYPALFVLSGLGLTIVWSSLREGGWQRLARFIPALAVWVGSFAANYFAFLRSSSHDPMLLNNYGPLRLSLWHFADVEKPLEMIFALQQSPFTILLGVAVFAFCVGGVYYWRQNRVTFSLLLTPLFFGLLASSLHLYPAVGRFYNFFTPAVAILIAAGVEALMRHGTEHSAPVATVLVALLFVQPVFSAREIVAHPMQAQEVRPILAYVRAHQRPGDAWYVYWHTQIAYRYYAETYGLGSPNAVLSSSFDGVHRDIFNQDAERLRGRRVWVIIANPGKMGGFDEFTLVVQAFDNAGTRLDTQWQTGAVALLYQMNPH